MVPIPGQILVLGVTCKLIDMHRDFDCKADATANS